MRPLLCWQSFRHSQDRMEGRKAPPTSFSNSSWGLLVPSTCAPLDLSMPCMAASALFQPHAERNEQQGAAGKQQAKDAFTAMSLFLAAVKTSASASHCWTLQPHQHPQSAFELERQHSIVTDHHLATLQMCACKDWRCSAPSDCFCTQRRELHKLRKNFASSARC